MGIFGLALVVRFLWFFDSTYFGFDEARDAFISQAIYKDLDFKLMGPPANAPGLNHGVLHWYILGLVYLIGGGSPFFVSAVFRIANASGMFLVYYLVNKLFGKKEAFLAAFLYAISFEQSQYAMYMGNPSLSILSWMLVFSGAAILFKNKNKFWGLPLMALGVATGAQLELFLVTLLPLSFLALLILRKNLKGLGVKSWLLSVGLGLAIVSPYIVSEIKYKFQGLNAALGLVQKGYNVIGDTETKWSVYFKRFILMFHDNVTPLPNEVLKVVAISLIAFLVVKAFKHIQYRLVLLWIFGGLFVVLFGAYNAYYVNVGIGTGILIGSSLFFTWIERKSRAVMIVFLMFVVAGNLSLIVKNNRTGLIEDIKTQQFMNLPDEIRVIDEMYQRANGEGFTVRATSMPYRIQAVWAYVFGQYGQNKYSYLPYWEVGPVLGYPGNLPVPQNGSTCIRYLLQEPTGGIPIVLTEFDLKEENKFSTVKESVEIGHFVIQVRQSVDAICHRNKAVANNRLEGHAKVQPDL